MRRHIHNGLLGLVVVTMALTLFVWRMPRRHKILHTDVRTRTTTVQEAYKHESPEKPLRKKEKPFSTQDSSSPSVNTVAPFSIVSDNRTETAPSPMEPDPEIEQEPVSMAAQVRGLIEQAKAESGPDADLLGRQLLNSKNPVLRVAGVAVLSELGQIDQEVLRKLATEETLSVLVSTIGWLLDTGNTQIAAQLENLLRERKVEAEALINLVFSEDLDAVGQRAALSLLERSTTAREELAGVLELVAEDVASDYSVRMKALYALRDLMNFDSFRGRVQQLLQDADNEDPVWREGLTRLAERLKGPIAVHIGPPTLTPHDVEEMLARPYPAMLEDLALLTEYVTSKPESYIQNGTAQLLDERLRELAEQPWNEEQENALRRLQEFVTRIRALEKDGPPPPNLPAPPPDLDTPE